MKFILGVFTLSSILLAGAPKKYSYRCSLEKDEFYLILNDREKVWAQDSGGALRVAPLSDPEKVTESGFKTLIYLGWNPSGKTALDRYDSRLEIWVRYQTGVGESKSQVASFVNHDWVKMRKCERRGMSLVTTPITEAEILAVDSERLKAQSKNINIDGKLRTIAMVNFLSVIRRHYQMKLISSPEILGTAIKYLPEVAIDEVKSQLKPEEKKFVEAMMEQGKYRTISDMDRYVYWFKTGADGNDDALRASIRLFLNSSLFQEKDLRTFFEKEVKKVFDKFSEVDKSRLTAQMLPAEKGYFNGLGKNVESAEVRASQPIEKVEGLAAALNKAILGIGRLDKWGTDKPGMEDFLNRMNDFRHSPLFSNPEFKAYFKAQVHPLMRKMEPKYIKRMKEWMTPEEYEYVLELRD